MSETDQFIGQKQDGLIWAGFQTFRELSNWMIAAHELQVNRPEAMRQEDGVIIIHMHPDTSLLSA